MHCGCLIRVQYASFRIDAEQTLVMGLPPPEVDNIHSYRNFGLTHSVKNVFIQGRQSTRIWSVGADIFARVSSCQIEDTRRCPPIQMIKRVSGKDLVPHEHHFTNRSHAADIDRQLKINHLAVIVQALLPSSSDSAAVSSRLGALLEEDQGEEEEEEEEIRGKLTLREMRIAALEVNAHQQTWRQSTVPAYTYAVGDLGYIPRGGDFDSFTVLCNVLHKKMASWDITQHAEGNQFSWEDSPHRRQDLQAFSFPPDVSA